jgi:alkylhydroperoxidase family enzyme
MIPEHRRLRGEQIIGIVAVVGQFNYFNRTASALEFSPAR